MQQRLGRIVQAEEGYTLSVGGFRRCVVSSIYELAAVSLTHDLDEFHFRAEGTCGCCRSSMHQLREVFFACRERLRVQALLAADPERCATAARGQHVCLPDDEVDERLQWEEEMQRIPDFPDFD
jgi:hypothetical protein